MNTVALIIRRHLAGGRQVTIPTLGTLLVERHSAQITDSGTRVSMPVKTVTMVDKKSTSIIDYIVHETHLDEVQATLLYNEWIDQANDQGKLTINGVGVIDIETSTFEINEEFDATLNPQPADKIMLKRATNVSKTVLKPIPGPSKGLMIVSIITAIISALYLIYYFADYFKAIIK